MASKLVCGDGREYSNGSATAGGGSLVTFLLVVDRKRAT